MSTHFDPNATNTIDVHCSPGIDCASSDTIEITIGNGFSVERDGSRRINAELKTEFDSGLDSFEANDFNYTLAKPSIQMTKNYR